MKEKYCNDLFLYNICFYQDNSGQFWNSALHSSRRSLHSCVSGKFQFCLHGPRYFVKMFK